MQAKQIRDLRHCHERTLDSLKRCNIFVYKTLEDSHSCSTQIAHDRGAIRLLLRNIYLWCSFMGLRLPTEHTRNL